MNLKSIKYLAGLSIIGLSLFAQGNEIVLETFDLNIPNQEVPLESTSNEAIQGVLGAILTETENTALTYLKHNDLRAAVKSDDRLIRNLSKDILMNIKNNPALFTGIEGLTYYMDKDNAGNPHDKATPSGNPALTALGPEGENKTKDGKEYYHVNEERNEKRKNVIFSVSFENISKKSDSSYDMDLLLFLHSDSTGHIFRYINISIDSNTAHPNLTKLVLNSNGNTSRTSVSNLVFNRNLKEVHLDDTNFSVHVELSTQKAVLTDANHGITKVIPLTAGSIDSRTASGDLTKVNSMTLLVPGREINYKDFNLEDSVLVKRKAWSANNNNSQRVSPAYYKGRPFIALIDRSRMNRNADGSLKKYQTRLDAKGNNTFVLKSDGQPILDEISGTPYYPAGYRLIGFHYQIEASGLKRGFESHGCLRLQDHDLYTVDAIVNAGPRDLVPIEVKMNLNHHADLDSIYKRSSNYKKVAYSTETPYENFTVHCKNKGSYPVRSFMGQDGRQYHTIADSDCLTGIRQVNSDVQELSEVLTGRSNSTISTLVSDVEHYHLAQRRQIIEENFSYVSYLRSDVLNTRYPGANDADFNYVLDLRTFNTSYRDQRVQQMEEIALVDDIISCQSNPECSSAASGYTPYVQSATLPRLVTDSYRQQKRAGYVGTRDAFYAYKDNCSGRVDGSNTPITNCAEFRYYLSQTGAQLQ